MSGSSENWSGRVGFVLATIGSAIGLGSIWKFPYEVGENGGGGFVLFYLLGLIVIVAPLMLAEFAIGRFGRSDARISLEQAARAHGASPWWGWVGGLGVFASALILSFYSVIGGWALAYAIETGWAGLPSASDAGAVQARFDGLLVSPLRMAIYHTVFLGLTALIVARGIGGGIEKATKILMPLLVVLMTGLAVTSLMNGDIVATWRYLFSFDPGRLTARVMLEAMGLGFFSIGVGLAVMITYAAYAGPDINLRSAAIIAIAGDTAISILAGFAIFPIVFQNGLDPASGPGLMFVVLPLAFAGLPGGSAMAVAFFVLLTVAALASAMSLLEMPVAFVRRTLGWSRPKGVGVTATLIWLFGFLSIFSFNLWREWFPLSAYPIFASATFFDILDYVTSNIMLPVGGFLLALFAGWVLPAEFLSATLGLAPTGSRLVRFCLRYLAPGGIAAATAVPLLAR